MSNQNKELTTEDSIKKGSPSSPSMNYRVLREEGLRLIRKYAGKTWTDHNIHDPGITILEILCYAMTELGLKTNTNIEDLLASGAGKFNDLYKATEILPSSAITINDYRKLLIDHAEVRNAWIEKHKTAAEVPFNYNAAKKELNYDTGKQVIIKGLYDVLIEFENADENINLNTNLLKTTLTTSIGTTYYLELVFPYWDELESKNLQDLEIQSAYVTTVPGTGGSTGNPVKKIQEEDGKYFAVLAISYTSGFSEELGVHIRFDKEIKEGDRDELLEYVDASTPGRLVELLSDTGENNLLNRFLKKNNRSKRIIKNLKHFLQENRNISEDFFSFSTARTQEIAVTADIDVLLGTSVEDMLAEVYVAIDQFLSPFINFRSYNNLREKGYPTEDIFEGPLLNNGFIADSDLTGNERIDPETGQQLIYTSDLFNLTKGLNITGISGEGKNSIIDLRNLSLSNYINNQVITDEVRNCLRLTLSNTYKPRLSIVKSDISVFKEGEKVDYDLNTVIKKFDEKKSDLSSVTTYPVDVLDIPEENQISLSHYDTIQNHFPLTYGIGEEGLPERASQERKAKAKQLKAYLLLFEQIHNNFLAQLNHIKELFSFNSQVDRTYFSQLLEDIPGLAYLLKKDYPKALEALTEEGGSRNMLERRNRFLNHLAARFAENPKDLNNLFQQNQEEMLDRLIAVKRKLLQNYPSISKNRFKAFNQLKLKDDNTPDVWNTDNISGYEKRVCHLLGFHTCYRRHLYNPLTNHFEIYEETDTDELTEWRFRLLDDEGNILLSSSTRYTDQQTMWNEIHQVVRFGKSQGNYSVFRSSDNKLYFNLTNASDEVLARRIEPFDSEEEAKNAIQNLIGFIEYTFSGEGIHMIENLLLRPETKGKDDTSSPLLLPTRFYNDEHQIFTDPYSFQITIIVPSGYQKDFTEEEPKREIIPGTERLREADFRRHMDRVLHNEAPAHTMIRIFRLDADNSGSMGDNPSLNNFERVYKKWLKAQASPDNGE
ncbi:MAG: hypothetical protein V5A47_11490, partial [Bacteroidales bacterium]